MTIDEVLQQFRTLAGGYRELSERFPPDSSLEIGFRSVAECIEAHCVDVERKHAADREGRWDRALRLQQAADGAATWARSAMLPPDPEPDFAITQQLASAVLYREARQLMEAV